MIVVLSGEGPSDLGCCSNGQGECQVPDFSYGPMICFVDKELDSLIGFSLRELTPESYIFVSKQELISLTQSVRQRRGSMSLRGRKRPELETGYFYINAMVLGERAVDLAEKHNDPCAIAILFRDSDGTHSASASMWQDKVNSIRQGFLDSALGKRGVAMVPKPKSESWMLCVLRDGYQNCARLEDLSGNDSSQNSAKRQLDKALAGDASTAAQLGQLEGKGVDGLRLAAEMPSYKAFRQNLALAYYEATQASR